MPIYKNVGGDSGIVAYECGDGWIEVSFRDGSSYRYTDSTVGAHNLARMKMLARQGSGLNAFINQNV